MIEKTIEELFRAGVNEVLRVGATGFFTCCTISVLNVATARRKHRQLILKRRCKKFRLFSKNEFKAG